MYKLFRETLRKVLPQKLYFNIRDAIKKDNEILFIYDLLKNKSNKSIMIDVGAHFGGSLIRFAIDNWKIYAFEPDNYNRSQLEELCNKYGFDNVIIDNRALSNNIEDDLSFYRSNISTGISGLSEFHSTHKEVQKVSSTTLIEIVKENNIDKVDFLKIDSEGWDYFVLKGFPFSKIKPRVIMAEFEDNKTIPQGYSWVDMASYLVDNKYYVLVSEWYPVEEYGGNHKWRKIAEYPCDLIDPSATGNLIAFNNLSDMQEIFVKINRIIN